ncbi:SDR family NAD(P)-dependent oxidoreductase [Microbacterium sp. SS28]|uniref:SDR family NAD(P)-dependent oxidoreductase n=1 Tax=Microbacterium sp. SS28 TaxID=2919948 RepID=UPI001FAA93DE|nr:SDR family oxidoreductase [Microbacterium sp. SS28]
MTTELLPLAGRRALITGASAGIGAAIARAFHRAGATCVLHGRDQSRLEQVAADLDARIIVADLTDRDAPQRVGAEAAKLGGLDIVVNNAGFEVDATVAELGSDLFAALLEVNLIAPVALLRECLSALRASGAASVINITSIHESVPVAGNGGYAAARAGLASLTRTASVELGPDGIRLDSIARGVIATSMNRDKIAEVGEDRFAEWIPLGYVADVDDVADVAVTWRASPRGTSQERPSSSTVGIATTS